MQNFLKINKENILLLLILTLGAFFRFYNLNWDQGRHLHPDERAIVIFTTALEWPKSVNEFFSPNSSWNPHFFAYGSFPLYLLKAIGNITALVDPLFGVYEKINIVGRFLSAIFDLGTLFILFLLTKKLFNRSIALLAAFFYTTSVLSIQLSHFYAVDTPLTFFVLVTLYQLVRFYEKPTRLRSALVGFFFGLSLATKTSALLLVSSIGLALTVDFLLIFFKSPHRPHIWFPHLPTFVKRLFVDGVIIIFITAITFIIVEPYAIIDFKTFWRQNMQQYQMTHDAFTFPYTLQYVGKIPYFYEIKNIFLWGQGPILATLSFIGALYFSFIALRKKKEKKWAQELILAVFFWAYFLVVGNFAIGFMRYMLPLYPLFCLFGAVFFYKLLESIPKKLYAIRYTLYACLLFSISWPLAFLHIYTKPNTRVLASEWIYKIVPPGKTLAIEHWDDSLPLFGQEKYRMITLPLYDPDTSQKWLLINQQLSQTDYLILASNRLYVPLQKLTNCEKLPPGKCYSNTAQYYRRLFNGENLNEKNIRFQKAAEFSTFPNFSFLIFNFSFDDSSADESFTVYDHPKVMIFKKTPN